MRPGAIDVDRLIGQVAARHGILLKADDAAFALVTMNQLVLEEVVQQVSGEIRARLSEFDATAERIEHRAGKELAQTVKEAASEIRRQMQVDLDAASLKARELVYQVHQAHSRPVVIRWVSIGILLGWLAFASGFLVGRMPALP